MISVDKKRVLFLLIIILAIAVFFRLWRLDSIPPGLYPDVAIYGNDAFDTLKTGNFRLFYPENNGREGLFMWVVAVSFFIFGVSVWSIKIVAATIGILTVFGLYLLTKELFKNLDFNVGDLKSETIALLSSFFLASSFWHTNFSRIGFRAILFPFILVFGFYFLLKGLRNQKILNFILSGIIFGLGFYTYISYRFIVLLLPIILLCWFFIYLKEKRIKKFLLFSVCCLFFIVIVALPIGIYFLQNSQDFIGRAAPISIFAAENPVKEFIKSLFLHLGMFNFYGDSNWRHNFAGSPILPWPLGLLFLVGITFSIKEIITSIKNKNCSTSAVHCSLLSWFFIMLLPGILTYEGIPHSLRAIGAIPATYILIGLGAWKSYQYFSQSIKNIKHKIKYEIKYEKLLILISFIFLFIIGFSEFNKYFFVWAKNPNVEGAFTKRFLDTGYFLNSLPEDYQTYVIVNESGVPVPWPKGIPMPAQTIMFIEKAKYGSLKSIYILPENLDQIKIPSCAKKVVIVPMKYDESLMDKLHNIFPKGRVEEKNGVWIFEVSFN